MRESKLASVICGLNERDQSNEKGGQNHVRFVPLEFIEIEYTATRNAVDCQVNDTEMTRKMLLSG